MSSSSLLRRSMKPLYQEVVLTWRALQAHFCFWVLVLRLISELFITHLDMQLNFCRRSLGVDIKTMKNATTHQATDIQRRCTELLKRIRWFWESQVAYMPQLCSVLSPTQQQIFDGGTFIEVEDMELYLLLLRFSVLFGLFSFI